MGICKFTNYSLFQLLKTLETHSGLWVFDFAQCPKMYYSQYIVDIMSCSERAVGHVSDCKRISCCVYVCRNGWSLPRCSGQIEPATARSKVSLGLPVTICDLLCTYMCQFVQLHTKHKFSLEPFKAYGLMNRPDNSEFTLCLTAHRIHTFKRSVLY